jgi:hypothetical protein
MILELVELIELLIRYRAWGIVVVLILLIIYLLTVILDEDRSAAWRARIYKGIYRLSGKSEAEKKYIENDISSRINLARRKMPFGKEYLPKSIKVVWFEGGNGEIASIKENEIIVRLDPMENQEKNIILLADALVKQTSLVGIRHILNQPLELSMDLNLVKNLLMEIGDKRILDWFFRNEYQPSLEQSEELKEWNTKIVEIDERGLFTRFLLVELDDYSKRMVGKSARPEMLAEIGGLVNFLFQIATKAYGQDVPLDYFSQNIKIGVVLVGYTSKIVSGIEPYLIAFAYKMQKQLTSIYIVRWDKELLGDAHPQAYKEFVEMAERLDERIRALFHISVDFELKYTSVDPKGNKRAARITRYIPEYVSR